MNKHKLIVLDGISGVPLGLELKEAISSLGVNTTYADMRKLPSRSLYALLSIFTKASNRWDSKDSFYHYPKLDETKFEEFLKEEQPTMVLVIGFIYKYLSMELMKNLKEKYGFKLFLYDTDSCNLYSKRREFIFFVNNELVIYDHIFSFSKVTTRFFTETKRLQATFLPFGASKILMPQVKAQATDVLFVGSCDLRRIFLLEQVKAEVAIYGDRWKRNYPLISDKLKANVTDVSIWGEALHQQLANAKIVLNITRTQFYGVETGVNLRIFEALAAGCFLLTDYCDEVAELFEIGEELEVFRCAKELAEKVDYYLQNPDKRYEIARKGYEAFLKKHTWENRAKQLLQKMTLDNCEQNGHEAATTVASDFDARAT